MRGTVLRSPRALSLPCPPHCSEPGRPARGRMGTLLRGTAPAVDGAGSGYVGVLVCMKERSRAASEPQVENHSELSTRNFLYSCFSLR